MRHLPKLFRTTAFRMSLLYMVLFGTAAALAIGYIYWNTNVLFTRQLEQTIGAEVQGLQEQYRDGGIAALADTVANRSLAAGNSLYLLAYPNLTLIAGNLRVPRASFERVGERFEMRYTAFRRGEPIQRLALVSVLQLPRGFYLIVGRDIEDRDEFERVIRSALIWGLGVMALVGLGGGWWLSRSLLARIDAVTATSRTIMAGDLSGRVPVTGSGDELDRLSENLNAMLERIEQLMQGLREVSDNIAHDLKTPLNRLRNRVETALREEGDDTAYRTALERTIEEADGLITTFNALLSIARLEAGAVRESMEDVDITALAQDVAELYAPAAEERRIALKTSVSNGLQIVGNKQLLGQAVANLLDNAIKYGHREDVDGNGAAGEIMLAGSRRDDAIELSIADDGPGVPQAERDRVLKRFVRLEASRSLPGSGLGLSLVSAVARLHGGSVRLHDNKPGLKVVLSLPTHQGGRADRQRGANT